MDMASVCINLQLHSITTVITQGCLRMVQQRGQVSGLQSTRAPLHEVFALDAPCGRVGSLFSCHERGHCIHVMRQHELF